MFVKQITTKLKEQEQHERESGAGGMSPSGATSNTLSVSQCDRLIRTVSCKHDTNHAIRKTNINVLQTFDDIKLYVSPSYSSIMMQPQTVQQQQQQQQEQFVQQNLRPHQLSPPPQSSNQNRLLTPNQQRLGDEISNGDLSSSLNDSLKISNDAPTPSQENFPAPLNFDRPPQHQSRPAARSPSSGLPPQSPSNFGESSRKQAVPNVYASAAAAAASDISEINAKDLLELVVENLACTNVTQWFSMPSSGPAAFNYTDPINSNLNLVESVQQALTNIDFNLKRNSDFINELTKLLDTSRVIKQEAYLKRVLKTLEDEKLNSSTLNVNNSSESRASLSDKYSKSNSASQPSSPALNRAASTKAGDDKNKKVDEAKKKVKSKSFRFPSSFKRSSSTATAPAASNTLAPATLQSAASASPIGGAETNKSQSFLNVNNNSGSTVKLKSTSNIDLNYYQSQHNEVNNSDYIELEVEVEKISYHLDSLYRAWSKLYSLILTNRSSAASSVDQLKFGIEFQSLINNLNSPLLVKDLEESLFKLNWLVTSKSGFSEPNWQTSVLSLTPSTLDSFIGVNLLKNYYKYVKYDFVSYKLFTRQLQLIQLCAILLNIVHRILAFYRESVTLSSITNTLNSSGQTVGGATSFSNFLYNDALSPTLLSFSFSADKYRPISWSANHVTLYNVQNNSANSRQNTMSPNLLANGVTSSQSPVNGAGEESNNNDQAPGTRPPSTGPKRGGVEKMVAPYVSREEQMRQIKDEIFLRDINEFLKLSTSRLNIQAQLANRTGYFYIVNQSTGLVLQAVDFTSSISLKEQVEQNQKRIASSSFKSINGNRSPSAGASQSVSSGGGSTVSKGPRFYLMPKVNTQNSHRKNQTILVAANNTNSLPTSSSLTSETASDEQLWYYYLINGCVANKVIRSGHCMAASSLNLKSPVCFWPNVKTTNCSWFFDSQDQTIVSGLNDDLVLDYVIVDEPQNPSQQRYAVVIDTKVPSKASQKWSLEFC